MAPRGAVMADQCLCVCMTRASIQLVGIVVLQRVTAAVTCVCTGMSPDFIDGLKASEADSSLLEISLSYPHVLPIMRLCTVEATRRKVQLT